MKRLLVLLALLWAAPASAQITNIFEMNCTSGNFRQCNFDFAHADNAYGGMALVTSGCPNGENSVRFTMNGVADHAQFYTGWTVTAETAPAQGSARFFRYRFKNTTPFAPQGPSDYWGQKFIDMGDSGTTPMSRLLVNLKPVTYLTNDVIGHQAARNIGGPPTDATDWKPATNDTWHSFQVEVKSSTTTGTTDGYTKIWIDNDTYASPTDQSNGMGFGVTGWGAIGFSGYNGASISIGNRVVYETCDFQYDDAFDSSYYATQGGGGGGGGVTRTRFRFFRVGGDAPAAGLAFACLVVPFLVRRRVA